MAAEHPPTIVIDASLALKWELNDEEFVENAVAVRDASLLIGQVRLIAPSLFVYEVINGITVAARRLRFNPSRGSQMLQRLFSVGVSLRTPDPARTYEIATRFQISAYDAAYVALAESAEAELWTADNPLFRAVSGSLPFVRWIGDWPLPPL
jgi:predicted nucleic acid-binding protein